MPDLTDISSTSRVTDENLPIELSPNPDNNRGTPSLESDTSLSSQSTGSSRHRFRGPIKLTKVMAAAHGVEIRGVVVSFED